MYNFIVKFKHQGDRGLNMLKTFFIVAAGMMISSCVWCSSGCDYYQPEKMQVKKTIAVGKGSCWVFNQCSDERSGVQFSGWSSPLADALAEQDIFEVVAGSEADYSVQVYDNTLYKFEDMCNMVLPLTLGLVPCLSTTEYNLNIEITDNQSGEVKTVNFRPTQRWFGHILLMPFTLIDYHTGNKCNNKIPAISRHIANIIYEEVYIKQKK